MKGFRSMGADIDIAHGLVIARAKELKAHTYSMDKVSVGATINIMMAAAWQMARLLSRMRLRSLMSLTWQTS